MIYYFCKKKLSFWRFTWFFATYFLIMIILHTFTHLFIFISLILLFIIFNSWILLITGDDLFSSSIRKLISIKYTRNSPSRILAKFMHVSDFLFNALAKKKKINKQTKTLNNLCYIFIILFTFALIYSKWYWPSIFGHFFFLNLGTLMYVP